LSVEVGNERILTALFVWHLIRAAMSTQRTFVHGPTISQQDRRAVRGIVRASEFACVELNDIKTLQALVLYFHDNIPDLLAHPADITVMFYWAFLAYNQQLLMHGLFHAHADSYLLRMLTRAHTGTPFIFHCSLGGVNILSIRGTAGTADILTSIKFAAGLQVPANVAPHFTDGILPTLKESMHGGIFNHALMCLSLYIDLPLDKTVPLRVYGHSLGAACSVVVAHLLMLMDWTDVSCYCLACPRVFTEDSPINDGMLKTRYIHMYTEEDPVAETNFRSRYQLICDGDSTKNIHIPYAQTIDTGSFIRPHSIFTRYSDVFKATTTCVENDVTKFVVCNNPDARVELLDIKFDNILYEKSSDSYGGCKKSSARHTKTDQRVRYKGRSRLVYVGARGGEYLKMNGRFVNLKSLPAAAAGHK
jgi:hypothetical protein